MNYNIPVTVIYGYSLC